MALATVVTVVALVLTALPSLERAVPRQAVWSAGRAGVSGSKSETAAAEPELAKLLSRRGSAVVRHDRSGYAATQPRRSAWARTRDRRAGKCSTTAP